MKKSLFDPFDGSDAIHTSKPVQILWDYEKQIVVDTGLCTMFDTCWTYVYDGITITGWWVLKDPWSDRKYLLEAEVPEMVRLAVMVNS